MKKILIILTIFLPLYSCYDYVEDYPKYDRSLNPKLEFYSPSGALANGVDSLQIRVIFPPNANLDTIKVKFSTTEGVFYENNKSEYTSSEIRRLENRNDRYIKATIKTTTSIERFFFTVEVPGVNKISGSLRFKPSYPVSINVSKNKFAVSRTFRDEIQLIANLKAEKGLPNKGTAVEFIVADSLSSNNSKLFRSITTTDSSGKATVLFTPGNFRGVTGTVPFKAITKDQNNNQIIATGSFEIIEPE